MSGLFIAGVGCTTRATVAEIVALVTASCARAGIDPADLVALASHIRKSDSLALAEAARSLGVPLRFLTAAQIDRPGVSEAVAAAAGTLILAKQKSAQATCAIARCAAGFDALAFGQSSASAAIASSTEATSWAGP